MSTSRDEQLSELAIAYTGFVRTVSELRPERFLRSLGDWTPRDIVAHFIGWNRITLVGCAEVREGILPFYFHDGTNDYRVVNAAFFARYPSSDRASLLADMAATMEALAAYLHSVPDGEWECDTGVPHYRGGPTTVARCVDSLLRDYRKHREEILTGLR
jgi:hypothetical protein